MTPLKRRSRITKGSKLLPSVHEQSAWARIMRDVHDAALEHVGGADYASEMQRLQCRRIGALEAELVHLENKIALAHQAGEEPSQNVVDLYLRAAAAQRRHCEALGWTRTAREVTNSLQSVIERHAQSKACLSPKRQGEGPAGAGAVDSHIDMGISHDIPGGDDV